MHKSKERITFAPETTNNRVMNEKLSTFIYRNEHPTVTLDDYFKATKAEFENICSEGYIEVEDMWGTLKSSGLEHHTSPLSQSEYLIDKATGDIYRKSGHWGENISTCAWTLHKGDETQNRYAIGKANVSDFKANIPVFVQKYIEIKKKYAKV